MRNKGTETPRYREHREHGATGQDCSPVASVSPWQNRETVRMAQGLDAAIRRNLEGLGYGE